MPPASSQDATDLTNVVFRQILHTDIGAHPCRAQDVIGSFPSDAVNVCEANLNPLRARKVDTCNSCHRLSLPLLVLGVGANNPDHPFAADNLAFDAHAFH